MSILEIVILISLAPALLIITAWYLPWERWIPWCKLPLPLLGPYILYGAFAAWFFQLRWWFVLLIAAIGSILTFIGIVTFSRRRLLR